MPKNIVICCDGTNNEIVGDQTNVLRLYRMLQKDEHQQLYYDAGVGTKVDPTALWWGRRRLLKQFDAAVGTSIRTHVVDAYRFLIERYEPSDKVYLFGFSRGAYTVRVLAGLIKRCGLLGPDDSHLAEYIWAVFSNEDHVKDRSRMFGGSARIKKVFGRRADIHFVGVWDTVSSFGWFYDQLTLPDTANNEQILHVRHGLSIDETRAFFRPNHFWPPPGQDCVEVWFAGVHADVGGGYLDDESGLARIALRWMLAEAKACGLRTEAERERAVLDKLGQRGAPDEIAKQHDESRKWKWRFGAWIPRAGYTRAAKGRTFRWPNRSKRRFIPEGALIHRSVELRIAEKAMRYEPQLPKDFTYVESKAEFL